jgi:hypothetical protein
MMVLFAGPGFGEAEAVVLGFSMPCCTWLIGLVAACIGCVAESKFATRIALLSCTFVGVFVAYLFVSDKSDLLSNVVGWRVFTGWMVMVIFTALAVWTNFVGSAASSEDKNDPPR